MCYFAARMKPEEASSGQAAHEDKNERDLFRIMTFSTALGFGVLAAFLYSLSDVTNEIKLVFSFGTVVAFAVGAAAGWAFWRGVRFLIRRDAEAGRR